VWAGVDSVWEQEKPEKPHRTHLSSARFVGRVLEEKDFFVRSIIDQVPQ
jgi:hypothetical protein